MFYKGKITTGADRRVNDILYNARLFVAAPPTGSISVCAAWAPCVLRDGVLRTPPQDEG
jgi:hypothetical protein